jgi:hypothetical protein
MLQWQEMCLGYTPTAAKLTLVSHPLLLHPSQPSLSLKTCRKVCSIVQSKFNLLRQPNNQQPTNQRAYRADPQRRSERWDHARSTPPSLHSHIDFFRLFTRAGFCIIGRDKGPAGSPLRQADHSRIALMRKKHTLHTLTSTQPTSS